jgi:hypothetical protein
VYPGRNKDTGVYLSFQARAMILELHNSTSWGAP